MGFFKIREIRSKTGELHFQRFRLLETPWFNIYIHHIAKSDQDKDPHNHPWSFFSLILWGGYIEKIYVKPIPIGNGRLHVERIYIGTNIKKIFSYGKSRLTEFHKIRLLKPTWTLVVTGPRKNNNWGYLTNRGFMQFDDYRKEKNT